jgi:D-ribose pyranose/furanose isomerase RbsD
LSHKLLALYLPYMDLDNTLTLHEQHTLFLELLREVKEINEKQTTLITILQEQQKILQSQQRYLVDSHSSFQSLTTNSKGGVPALRVVGR